MTIRKAITSSLTPSAHFVLTTVQQVEASLVPRKCCLTYRGDTPPFDPQPTVTEHVYHCGKRVYLVVQCLLCIEHGFVHWDNTSHAG